jgi:PmbA protein
VIEELREKAAALLEQANARGADEAQVIAQHQTTTKIRFEKNDFNCTSTNTRMDVGLKVHKAKRKGTASTNELDAAAIADTAGRAMTLAGFSLEDEYLVLPDAQEEVSFPGRYDPALAAMPASDLHRLAADFVAIVGESPKLSVDGADLSITVVEEVLRNSRGLDRSDRITRIDWSAMGFGKTETETTSLDYLWGGSWAWDGVAQEMNETARRLSEQLLATFGARQAPSYKGQVLLSPAVIHELLVQPISFHISGSQIMDGKSRWENSLGESVASSGFSLSDNPFNLDLGDASPYDAEGVSVSRTPLIEGGVLLEHIDSCYSANRRGTVTTGHCGGLHGIEIAPGSKSREELIAMADKLVVVERFSGNVDPISGDFSGIAKSSHYHEKGEYQHPLAEMMIAGNCFDLLKSMVGLSDSAVPYCNWFVTPWILVDGVSVTAG